MKKILFVFTNNFPFSIGEPFFENEIPYLYDSFDQIIIISNDMISSQTREIPDDIEILRFPYTLSKVQKLTSFTNVFNPLFWKELKTIKRKYKIKVRKEIISTMLQTIEKSKGYNRLISNLIQDRNTNSNLYYLYSYWNNDIAFAISKYKKKHPDVIAFSRMHGSDAFFEANNIGYLPFRKYILDNLDFVFSISRKAKLYYNNLFNGIDKKIKVCRLGVQQQRYQKYEDNSVLKIVSVSVLIPIKNVETIVDGLNLLEKDFYWTHFGTGQLHECLEQKANAHFKGKFEFKGHLSNNELLKFYSNNYIDLLINVSLSEGIPVSIMEAMSFGIPVIASNVGGTSEIVKHGYNGFLLSARPKPEEVQKQVLYFYNLSRAEKEQLRQNAFKTWERLYNAQRNYTNFTKQISLF